MRNSEIFSTFSKKHRLWVLVWAALIRKPALYAYICKMKAHISLHIPTVWFCYWTRLFESYLVRKPKDRYCPEEVVLASTIQSMFWVEIRKIMFAPVNPSFTVWASSCEKPDLCICENKGADQLCGDRTTDQRLCFRYTDSTIPLLPISEFLSL